MIDQSHPVVIDFTQHVSPFEELWPTTHRALLPVIGKSILVHTLERLRNIGYRHFRIARHLQQPFVKNRLGNGREWGVTLRYSDLSGSELLNETLMSFGQCLSLKGDELLGSRWSYEEHQEAPWIAAPDIQPGQAGLYRLAKGELSYRALVEEPGTANKIQTIKEYQQLCFAYCAAFQSADTAPGALLHRSAQADWKTQIAPDVLVGGCCFVGKHCHVSRGAILEDSCVLGNGVYVDKKARLKNCVVLPNTYVGKNVKLHDCVASSAGAVHVSGEFVKSPSVSALASTRRNHEHLTGLPRNIQKFLQA